MRQRQSLDCPTGVLMGQVGDGGRLGGASTYILSDYHMAPSQVINTQCILRSSSLIDKLRHPSATHTDMRHLDRLRSTPELTRSQGGSAMLCDNGSSDTDSGNHCVLGFRANPVEHTQSVDEIVSRISS